MQSLLTAFLIIYEPFLNGICPDRVKIAKLFILMFKKGHGYKNSGYSISIEYFHDLLNSGVQEAVWIPRDFCKGEKAT